MEFDVVIGLEIHAELKTKTKIFCSCKNEFGAKPNTNTCPICTGMPGALPIINKRAVELCIKAGLCFGCEINSHAEMERKNYFYPDLSKAYQISQLVHPICLGGKVVLDSGKEMKLNRIHLEEDAGKLIHISKAEGTLIDYNRGGTPLIEIVTEPVFESAEEVDEFLRKVRETLVFADVADCKMEQGGMRCDVNLSLKPKGSKILGTRTEMKNLNSFKSVSRAICYEIERQKEVLSHGGVVYQETRKWDDALGENFTMRSKEETQDYRYFPDPDILPFDITEEDKERIAKEIPTLPHERRRKYVSEYGISKNDSEHLTESKYVSDYFEKCVSYFNCPKKISNWILTDLFRMVKDSESPIFPISEKDLATIVKMTEEGKITKTNGLVLMEKVVETKEEPEVLAKELNLLSSITEADIVKILEKFKAENPKAVEDFKKDPKVMSFIIGYVMKNTQGKANGTVVRDLISKMF